jgi:hypothetical protein
MMLGVAADNAIQSTQRYRVFDKDVFDISDINSRHKNNGWIGANLKNKSIRDIFGQFQSQDTSLNSVEFIMRYINDAAQRVSTKTDMSRQAAMGGVQNQTATAASILNATGEMLDSDLLEAFSYGLIDLAEINTILLTQYLGDRFTVKPFADRPARVLSKAEILGRYDYMVKTSLQTNTIINSSRILNGITQLINLANSGRPELANMNILKPVRDAIKALELGDADEILPATPANPQAQPTPGAPAPGGPAAPMEAMNAMA